MTFLKREKKYWWGRTQLSLWHVRHVWHVKWPFWNESNTISLLEWKWETGVKYPWITWDLTIYLWDLRADRADRAGFSKRGRGTAEFDRVLCYWVRNYIMGSKDVSLGSQGPDMWDTCDMLNNIFEMRETLLGGRTQLSLRHVRHMWHVK